MESFISLSIFVAILFVLCLNPCCNGIFYKKSKNNGSKNRTASLNPCCNGIFYKALCTKV